MASSSGEPTQFKDSLRRLIEANGGMTPADVGRIVEKVREVSPDFSDRRLRDLLNGFAPSEDERRGISLALEPLDDRWLSKRWKLEDAASRRIANWVFIFSAYDLVSNYSRQRFAENVVSNLLPHVSYRNERLSKTDLRKMVHEYLPQARLEDEIELFGLGPISP